MNRKIKLGLLIVSFGFLLSSVYTASGAVIQDVVMTGDFGLDGLPSGEQFVFIPQDDDAVYVWVNMTDVYANDTLTFKYIQPNGDTYYTHEWVAYHWIDGIPYTMFSEIEVQASPVADLPGKWVLKIYNEDTLWGNIAFEIIDDGTSQTSTDTSSNDIVRGYYIWIEEVTPVGEVVIGENATIEIVIKYDYPIQSPLVPSILDENFELRGDTFDEILDDGLETYTVSMTTRAGDDSKIFYAVAYYYVDGNWTFMDPGGYMPFTLSEGSSGVTSIPSGTGLPDGLDLSDINMDQITRALEDTYQKGLEMLENIEIPEEVTQIEEVIKERTGIPGFPVEAILVGAAAIGLALRKRD